LNFSNFGVMCVTDQCIETLGGTPDLENRFVPRVESPKSSWIAHQEALMFAGCLSLPWQVGLQDAEVATRESRLVN